MLTAFYIVQVLLSVTLIAVILLQTKSAGLGSAFGSSDASIYQTRRGLDRILFNFTIALAVLFAGTSVLVLIFSRL